MMSHCLGFLFLTAMTSFSFAASPEDAGARLFAGMKFFVEGTFPSDPQVTGAVEMTREFLSRMGLEESEDAVWRVRVLRNAVSPAGGYRLRGAADGVVVEASDAEGVRCGLMALLQRLGVRWYDLAEEPSLPPLPVALPSFEENAEPSFPYRGLHICAGAHHYDDALVRWMSFHRMNRKLAHVYQLPHVGETLKKRGIAPDTTVHSYSEWVPDKKFFATNPEFFSLLDNRRIKNGEGGQLCHSNKEMRAAFVREVRAFLDGHPEIAIIGVCPNDGYGWCECEECRKLDTPEDRATGKVNARVADFLEDVCAEILKTHPNVLVGHYAYSNFIDFHKALKHPPSNLMVSCTTSRCYRHAINDPQCPTNRRVAVRLWELRERVPHVYVYDYMYYRWEGLPHPQWRVVEQDVAAYAKMGLDGYMTETGGAASFAEGHLVLYILAQLLYDRHADVEALLGDYCTKRFGKAAKSMRAYLAFWEEAIAGMDGCLIRGRDDLERLIPPKVAADGRRLLDDAIRADPGNGAVQHESAMFDRWAHILRERRQAARPTQINVLPMEEFERERNGMATRSDGLLFLDHTLKIPPAEHPSRARFYSDGKSLGIVIDCEERYPEKAKDRPGNSAGEVYGSDNVEIFLRDGSQDSICYHILISISGGHCASECQGTRWNWAWEGDYQATVKRSHDRWKVFFEIPLSKINAKKMVALTLIRNRHVDDWEKTGIPDGGVFFNVKDYLEMVVPSPL